MATATNKAKDAKLNTFRGGPDERGHFGIFGGRFVAETLMPLILDLRAGLRRAKADPKFHAELAASQHALFRPAEPALFRRAADRASRGRRDGGGAKIYFKRDELNHTGSHKINNCLGQILLAHAHGQDAHHRRDRRRPARRRRRDRLRALRTAVRDLHGRDRRRAPEAQRRSACSMLRAKVNPVTSGAGTLKDAMNEALRDWVTNVHDTYYIIGTAAGPHPYPEMVRDFQSIIGKEVREQMQEAEGRLPDTLVACIGGGSNAIGLFHPFLDDESVKIYGVEAGGHGLEVENGHAASMNGGRPGVLHGNRTYLLQDADGQILEGHSISAGLDYPGVGPEHAWLKDTGRVNYVPATDKEALDAFQLCARLEGIIPALEPAHALAYVTKLAPTLPKDNLLVMNMCGRGDKDIFAVAGHLGMEI